MQSFFDINNIFMVTMLIFFISPDGYVADEYALTPNMSTYLLAFIVCDFQYTENVTRNNIKVSMPTEQWSF